MLVDHSIAFTNQYNLNFQPVPKRNGGEAMGVCVCVSVCVYCRERKRNGEIERVNLGIYSGYG